jgi:hypothetical protein
LGQYLGDVFPSSRVAQSEGEGFVGGVGLSPPSVRPMTAAELRAAREEMRMVLASILKMVVEA